jgi:sorbose reductase
MAEAGAHVAIVYQSSKTAAKSAAAEIRSSYGVKSSTYQAEVSDAAAIEAVVSAVVAEFGRLDIAVINAGISAEFDALECSPEEYHKQMSVNLDGAFYSAQAAARVFKQQGTGNIIFTTSISASIVNGPQFQSVVSFRDA